MKQHLFKWSGLVVFIAIITTTAVTVTRTAESLRYPTYQYDGKVLDVEEFIALVDSDTPLACTELPSVERYVNEQSTEVDYICFRTQSGLDAHIKAVIEPEFERLAETYSNVQRAQPDVKSNTF